MFILRIEFRDGRKIEKTAAYSPSISWRLFDAWQRDRDTLNVELIDPRGERVALIKKGG